jgi:hypothetical protein
MRHLAFLISILVLVGCKTNSGVDAYGRPPFLSQRPRPSAASTSLRTPGVWAAETGCNTGTRACGLCLVTARSLVSWESNKKTVHPSLLAASRTDRVFAARTCPEGRVNGRSGDLSFPLPS